MSYWAINKEERRLKNVALSFSFLLELSTWPSCPPSNPSSPPSDLSCLPSSPPSNPCDPLSFFLSQLPTSLFYDPFRLSNRLCCPPSNSSSPPSDLSCLPSSPPSNPCDPLSFAPYRLSNPLSVFLLCLCVPLSIRFSRPCGLAPGPKRRAIIQSRPPPTG